MKNLIRLLLIGLLASTTGCFGWTENAIDRYCTCDDARAAAHRFERGSAEHDAVAKARSDIDGITGDIPSKPPTSRPCAIHDPGNDIEKAIVAYGTIPVVAVAEGVTSVVGVTLFVIFLPIILPALPRC